MKIELDIDDRCVWIPYLPWPYWREAGGAKPIDPCAKDCPAWAEKEPKP